MTTILGIKLKDRIETSAEFQKITTKFGCIIKTRLGIHKTENCENYGIILLEVENESADGLISALSEICSIQKMIF